MIKKIECRGCGKQYRVDLNSIKTDKASLTCKSCGHKTIIDVFSLPSVEIIEDAGLHKTDLQKKSFLKGLKFQINSLIVFIVLVIMGGYAGFSYESSKSKMEKDLLYSADIAAQRLSKHLREPFWAIDDEILKEALASEMLDKQIYAINIVDRNGADVYMGYRRNENWEVVQAEPNPLKGDYIARRADIVRGDDKIGAVEVYLTDTFLKIDFNRSMITIATTVAVLVLAIVFFVSFTFQKMIIRPITDMAGLADRISMGDMDITIPVGGSYEIGLLAQSFNRLKTSLKIGMQAFGAK